MKKWKQWHQKSYDDFCDDDIDDADGDDVKENDEDEDWVEVFLVASQTSAQFSSRLHTDAAAIHALIKQNQFRMKMMMMMVVVWG